MAPVSSVSVRPAGRVPLILCGGTAVLDHVYRLEQFPEPGTKTRARDFLALAGGCAANAAITIKRLGGRVRLAAPLGGPAGADAVGDVIVARLAQEGIDLSGLLRVDDMSSGTSAILLDAAGERTIVTHRDMRLADTRLADPAQMVADVDALLVDNRFVDFVLPLAAAARQRNLPIVLDADRPAGVVPALLAAATHVIFAADALRNSTGIEDFDAALRKITGMTEAFLGVTDGPRGVFWVDGAELRHFPGFSVAAVDTLGAGDVFHGAFALALAEGQPTADAMRFAAAAAALKCTRFGGGAAAPERSEVEALLAAG
jgi:sugar/nucleoside kinase (ribokinase family)